MIIASERSCSKLLNKNKCQFCKDFFSGHTISPEGIIVDPSNTDAITKMYVPQSLTELQTF